MTRLVRSGDLGLDVVLGGGWRLVEKLPGKESTTIIIRGGPGAGKTLFSVDIALALANALSGDVVVACVELLPSEYLAQVESARPTLVKPPSDAEPNWQPSVFLIGNEKIAAVTDQLRTFRGLLDELDSETPDLTAAIDVPLIIFESCGETDSTLNNIADVQLSLGKQIGGAAIEGRITSIQGKIGRFSISPLNQNIQLFGTTLLDENHFGD